MKHLTIRDIPPELARGLEAEKKRLGQSLNQTLKDLLRQALGLESTSPPAENGLGRFAGTWSDEELSEFEKNTSVFEAVDPELWR
jgi:hypothetical protein